MTRVLCTLALVLCACVPNYEGAPCGSDDHCPTYQICNSDLRCEIGKRPTGTCASDAQPGGCGNGSVCNSARVCQALSEGMCAEAWRPLQWTASSRGLVIFNTRDEPDVAADCTTGNAFTMTVFAYSAFSLVPASLSEVPKLTAYFEGSMVEVSPTLKEANYTRFNEGAQIGLTFTLCRPETTEVRLAVAFEDGNQVCTTQRR
ncbi:MAG: hypothetical protein QM817_19795 [Archangium sp.]